MAVKTLELSGHLQMNSTTGIGRSEQSASLKRRNQLKEVIGWHVKNWIKYRWRELPLLAVLRLKRFIPGLCPLVGCVRLDVIKANGERIKYGVAGRHLITTAGKGFIRDAWTNGVELENMKYHALGTSSTSPAVGDTTLGTELTTQYSSDNTRATGSTTTNGANVFRSVGTVTVDASVAAVEWGLFSQASNAGGVLFDRQTFSVINLASGDSIAITYDLTIG